MNTEIEKTRYLVLFNDNTWRIYNTPKGMRKAVFDAMHEDMPCIFFKLRYQEDDLLCQVDLPQ